MQQSQPSEKFRFLYFTDLVGMKVVSSAGAPMGRLADLIAVSGEPYPPVESLVVRLARKLWQVPWTSVESVNGSIRLTPGAALEPIPEAPVPDARPAPRSAGAAPRGSRRSPQSA